MRTTMKKTALAKKVLRKLINTTHEKSGDLTVGSIACQFGISATFLCTAFKEYTGQSLGYHIILKKQNAFCELAKRHLNKTIKELLDILDIQSQSHFAKKFRERFGKTPVEAVREIRKIHLKARAEALAEYKERKENKSR